jgi:hypothetical protein
MDRYKLFSVLLAGASLNTSTFDGTIAVVGNGPISEADRAAIEAHQVVVRFNDVNFMRRGERVTLHVVREPTAMEPRVPVDAPIWDVSPMRSFLRSDAALTSPVYERDYNDAEWTSPNSVIFPSCGICPSCRQANSFAGPSTGALAISELNELDAVNRIDVYGMNWVGAARIHIDFENKTLVQDCCHSCIFHHTASDYYGTGLTALGLVLVVSAGCVFVSFLMGFFVEEVAPRARQKEQLPLLSLPLDMDTPLQDPKGSK